MTLDEQLQQLKDGATTELNFCRTQLGVSGFQKIASVLKREGHKLTRLNLSDTQIGEEGVVILGEILPYCPALTELELRNDFMGDEGITHILRGLKEHQTPIKLDFYRNKIGDKTILELVGLLYGGCPITDLQLGSNQIGDDGLKALSQALITNSSVIRLNVEANSDIGEEGATALGDMLAVNRTLTNISIHGIGQDTDRLAENILQNKNLLSTQLHTPSIDRHIRRNNSEAERYKHLLIKAEPIPTEELQNAFDRSSAIKRCFDQTVFSVETKKLMIRLACNNGGFLEENIPNLLQVLGVRETLALLEERGHSLTMGDLVQGENFAALVQAKRVPELFVHAAEFENKTQLRTCLRAMSDSQREALPNIHTLVAKLQKRTVSEVVL